MYQIALGDYEAKSYESAVNNFEELLDDETFGLDAKEHLYLCAKAMYDMGSKDIASQCFEKIKDYKDANEFIKKTDINTLSSHEPNKNTSGNLNKTDNKISNDSQSAELLQKIQGTWFYDGGNSIYDEKISFNGTSCTCTTYFYMMDGVGTGSPTRSESGELDIISKETTSFTIKGSDIIFSATTYTNYDADGAVLGGNTVAESTRKITKITDTMLEFDYFQRYYRI